MSIDQFEYNCEVLGMFNDDSLDDYVDFFFTRLSGNGGE